jgi:UDP-glucose 4-epimerase
MVYSTGENRRIYFVLLYAVHRASQDVFLAFRAGKGPSRAAHPAVSTGRRTSRLAKCPGHFAWQGVEKPAGTEYHRRAGGNSGLRTPEGTVNYLITGGAGFIGSHLAQELLARGHRVSVIDNLSTGSIKNIQDMTAEAKFSYIIDDIANEPVLAELIDGADVIFHLAAAVGVKLIVESPVHTIETNIYGTQLVFKHAAKKKRKVILASTSEVYGKSNKVPFCEDDDMVLGQTKKSRWSYAASKLVDEFLALSYTKEGKVPAVVVRLFNTVGPRQVGHYGMVIPRFIAQALDGGPITVYGDGEQSRCFCYVGDAVKGLMSLSESEEAVGDVFNLGSDAEITINGLALKVRKLVNEAARIEHIPYEQAYEEGFEDMRRRVPDTGKISRLIGFRPSKNIDEILELTAAYMREDKAGR